MNKLKELRKTIGSSQTELAEKMSVSQNTISQWENGTREPDNETLKKLADYFDVSVDYLLGRTDIPNTIDKQLSEEDRALFGETRDLTDDEMKRVINFIKFTKSTRNMG